jgi:hypothetical protein
MRRFYPTQLYIVQLFVFVRRYDKKLRCDIECLHHLPGG